MTPWPSLQVLSDEVKRKQYDTYGSAGFDPGSAGSGQRYWGKGPTVDPEELFRKIFGEFSGSPFGDFHTVFDQPQEVSLDRCGVPSLSTACFKGRKCCILPLEVQAVARGWAGEVFPKGSWWPRGSRLFLTKANSLFRGNRPVDKRWSGSALIG